MHKQIPNKLKNSVIPAEAGIQFVGFLIKSFSKLFLIPSAAFLFTACAIGPDYARPNIETPNAWRNTEMASEKLSEISDQAWWEQFNDPTLNALVSEALANNFDLKIAEARVTEYAARYGVSRADLLPQIGAGATQTRQFNTQASNARNIAESNVAAFSGSWEIDLWGKIRRQMEASKAKFIGSDEARRGVAISIASAVASSYLNLRSLDAQLEITKNTLQTREATQKLFEARFTGGIVSLVELSQVKSQYEEASAAIPALEALIAEQENALSLLLGKSFSGAANTANTANSSANAFSIIARGKALNELSTPIIKADLPSTLLERRPDILAAEQDLIAANAIIGATKALYFPSISLTGLIGSASFELSGLFHAGSRFWQGESAINLPIFTAGKIGAQVEIAESQQQQALFNYQKTVQNAFREVDNALTGQAKTRSQLAAQTKQAEALKQYAESARLRYENGYTSFIEVLDAERALYAGELQQTRVNQALLQRMIDLYKALGGGF